MARFFQTTRPEFIDNFLYQPPWELALATLEKKEADIQNQVDTMEILRNLPIDYANVDRDNAMRIKDAYANQIDTMAQELQKNLLNPNNKTALRNLQRDIQRSYEFGDINKIQKNAQAFREWDAKLQQLNPYERETYKKAMMQEYIQGNPDGALSGLFTPGEMYNSRNLLGEFAEYASKNIKDDTVSKAFEKVNGQWLVKESASNNGVTVDKIQNAFRGWVDSQADLPGYFDNRERYFGEKYFNQDRSLAYDTEGTTLNNILNSTRSLAWNKSTTSQELDVNPYALEQVRFQNDMAKMDKQFGQQVALAKLKGETSGGSGGRGKNTDEVASGSAVHKGLIKVSDALQQKKKDLVAKIKQQLKITGQATKSAALEDDYLFSLIRRNKDKYGSLYKEVDALESNLNKSLSASWKSYQDIVGRKEVENLKKDVDSHLNGNTKFYIGRTDSEEVQDNLLSLNKISKAFPNTKVKPIEGSGVPISMGTDRMVDDYVRYTIRMSNPGNESFEDRYIYIPMSQISTNYNAPGFAGASDATVDRLLSGEN